MNAFGMQDCRCMVGGGVASFKEDGALGTGVHRNKINKICLRSILLKRPISATGLSTIFFF